MKTLPEIDALVPEMKEWRHHIHAHPETAFEETETSAFVAEKLRGFGLEVHTGMAKTGVVGVLHGNGSEASGSAIGLRADLDALHVHERSGVPYASRHEGKMHACGHDGHTTMLLGAAKALAGKKSCEGTVYFIFQPAEENEGGGRVMVEEGLFDKFPMRAIYGMHNCMNFVTESDGKAGAVLIRAATALAGFPDRRPSSLTRQSSKGPSEGPLLPPRTSAAGRSPSSLTRLLTGPGKLCAALGITRADLGHDLTRPGTFYVADDGSRPPRRATSARIGVDYAGAWAARKLRFYVAGSPDVCKP